MIKLSAIVLASLVAASVASAASDDYTATLAKPVAKSTEFIVEDNLFRCEGTACIIVSKPVSPGAVSTCRKLARQAGEITAYGSAASPFDADKLAHCNAK